MAAQGSRLIAALAAVILCGTLAGAPARASEQSELLYSRGLVEFHKGKFTEALALFDQAVQADPSDVYARYYKGVTEGRLGNYDAAVTDLRTVMDAKPDLSQGALELGVALVETGNFKEAIDWLAKAQQVPALDADASFYLGIAQMRAGDLDAARSNFERAIQRKPDLELAARYYLGIVEYRAGRYQESQQHFDWVIETSPDSAVAQEARDFQTKMQEGPVRSVRPWEVFGSFGLAYDSNLQLVPSDDGIDAALGVSDEADGRAEILAGALYSPYRSERVEFTLAYSFFQTLQFDLTQFNLQDHRPQAQLTVRAGPAQFNLLGRYDFYLRDTSSFLSQATALPWVSIEEGVRAHPGVLPDALPRLPAGSLRRFPQRFLERPGHPAVHLPRPTGPLRVLRVSVRLLRPHRRPIDAIRLQRQSRQRRHRLGFPLRHHQRGGLRLYATELPLDQRRPDR